MKDKILAALKNKFKNMGFSDKAFEGVADHLATTVTEEDKIETAVSGVEGLLKAFQGDVDKRVSDAVKKAKEEAAKKKQAGGDNQSNPNTPQPPAGGESDDDAPAWAKAIIQSNENLQKELAAIKGEKVAQTRQQTLQSVFDSDDLKGAPDFFKKQVLKNFNRMSFDSEDVFNEYLEEVKADAKTAIQEAADKGLGAQQRPYLGKTDADGVSASTKSYIESKKAGAESANNGLGGKKL